MRTTKIITTLIAIIAIQLFPILNPLNAQDHVVLNSFNVNLRTGPGTDHYVVCLAGKGEIFKLAGEQGDWIEIEMCSGDNRFVHCDLVYFLTEFVDGHNMKFPEQEEKTKEIYQDILWAKSLAKHNADEIIPVEVNKERYNNFLKICQDKHIHDIFEKHGVQTAMYPQIMEYAEKEKW